MEKVCENCEIGFMIDEKDREFYQKIQVPAPKCCPACRRARRMAFSNTFSLYPGRCALTGTSMLSRFGPSSPFKNVYANAAYWSDQWDPYRYGRDFDFSRPFFEQLFELACAVPHQALSVDSGTMENSDFCNLVGHLKNCYLVFVADFDENCFYTLRTSHCRDTADAEGCFRCELCYQCTRCEQCYESQYCFECVKCTDCLFCFDCVNCQNCFGCTNLKNKQYCLYNEQKTPEEYKKFLAALPLGSRKGVKKLKAEVAQKTQGRKVRAYFGVKNEEVSGNYIFNSKDARYCFDVRGVEHGKFCDVLTLPSTKDAWDYYQWGNDAQLLYECVSCGEGAYELKFCYNCWPGCRALEYCMECSSSSSCFGCVGLKKGAYSILNKRYAKDEYEKLKTRLVAHMKEAGEYGEFFPMPCSPFAYNETDAGIELQPIAKDEALAKRWRWEDNLPFTAGKATIAQEKVSDDIEGVGEELSREILACVECGRNYKVIQQEIALYKKMRVPAPANCFLCRFRAHWEKMPGRTLYERACAQCGAALQTSYAFARPEKALCEICYRDEV